MDTKTGHDRDETPDGDGIHTTTFWLAFPDGDAAISIDTTKFDAAMKRAQQATKRR